MTPYKLKLPPVYIALKKVRFLLYATLVITGGCSLEKQSGLNRNLQNLTAKYNILFNANEILRAKQESYAAGWLDNYSELLSVYTDTAAAAGVVDKDLEAVKTRANSIISIKEQSHYIGDAYLLLGKANYLGGNYFDAVEYFNYVTRSFDKQPQLDQEALVWKARSLLYLNKTAEAKAVLDTALKNINPKKSISADVYAAKLQYDINTLDYADGEEMAKQAIHYSGSKMQRLRWTFILAQLQELNQHQADAIASYNRVANSNVGFDMAFNANLNRIRIEDQQNGVKISRINRLRSLLRNQNNKEFSDQIYFQIASLQYTDHQVDEALKSYKQSIRASQKNQNQKGLSYLRLADIYFKDRNDYTVAKNYYDSTLITLLPNYTGYTTIKKKADNLQLLTNNLQIIAREDTLQVLVAMNEQNRNARIDVMVRQYTLQLQNVADKTSADAAFDANQPAQESVPNGGNFYFYNAKAVSQGFNDFKRVWGNRKLEDNWRRSNRPASDLTANAINNSKNIDPDAVADNLQRSPNQVNAGNYRQDIIQNLPLTPALLARSNQRRYDAYLNIANFYRDILADKKEAAEAYEVLLARFPASPDKPSIYYNLYRLYSDSNTGLADKYKNLLVNNYPQTPFARIITDPDYSKRLNDDEANLSGLYNKVYDLYAGKQYTQVVTNADELLKLYPNSRYAPQLYYLRAFAAAHQEKVDPFKNDLTQIIIKYPEDRLITPLINQHIIYINTNHDELAARPVVIADGDNLAEFTIPIVYQQKTEYRVPVTDRPIVVADIRAPDKNLSTPPAQVTQAPVTGKPVVAPVIVNNAPKKGAATPVQIPLVASIFNTRDSTNYYFVVSVSSATTNLASSRFGIGQFNRVNFEQGAINHNLVSIGNNTQLIYVGRFYNLTNVKDYARAIIPLLPDIMKVPKDKYSFFIITQENLNKLADQKLLDSYIDYYQKNY